MEASLVPAMAMAFFAGLLSFLSPCVLPLVPGYLSIISGVSLDRLKSEQQDASLKRSVIISSIMFIIGFSITFIVLGASASALSKAVLTRMPILMKIAGVIIIVFGLHLLGVFRINALYQDKRMHNVQTSRGALGAMVLGLVFALGWFLLAVYSSGLGVPFLLTSLGLNRFLAFYTRFKKHFRTLEIVSGVLVLGIGILIFTGQMTVMNQYFQFLNSIEYKIEETFMRMLGGN
jgi:cytochrome c-type biogenesis protein